MLKEAGMKLPARKATPASPNNVAGLPNIPLSCFPAELFGETTRPSPMMFLWMGRGQRKKKEGTFIFRAAFFKHRPPGPPRIPLVHWPAP
jgi:hypothetical protein